MIFLDVPFKEKDHAKSLGARWDSASKKWYVPHELSEQTDAFQKWLAPTLIDTSLVNVTAQQRTDDTGLNLGFGQAAEKVQKGATLSSVLKEVQYALANRFPGALWVMAEIANLNERRGHLYLELTESNAQGQTLAQCRAMLWASQAPRILTQFETQTGSALAIGQKVLLLAEMTFHEQYGFSMVVQDIDPSYTLGELEANVNNIRKQLILEGIYTQNKQLTLPKDFFRVAVIAPPAAAGLGDFRIDADILQKTGLCEFTYFYSAFQGESVESEMSAAFEAMQSLHSAHAFDALVIIRGGGAKLDLNSLNKYTLAKHICLAKLPVLTGIGHERDNTILDEVAQSRFDTPSKVIAAIRQAIFSQAHLAQQHWQHIDQASRLWVRQAQNHLQQLNHGIGQNSQNLVYRWKNQLVPLKHQLERRCDAVVRNASQTITQLNQVVNAQTSNKINLKKLQLQQHHTQISIESKRVVEQKRQQMVQWIGFILSSGPKTQLNRGFVIAKDQNGQPLKTAQQALKSQTVHLVFMDGTLKARIEPQTLIQEPHQLSDSIDTINKSEQSKE